MQKNIENEDIPPEIRITIADENIKRLELL